MENYIILGLIILVFVVTSTLASNLNKKRKVFKNNTYTYVTKDPMTRAEADIIKALINANNAN